jgi:hypothetical protein
MTANPTPPPFPILKTILLKEPLNQTGQNPLRYGITHFFQVSPTQIALLANLRVTNMPVVDHEDGWDVFILDDIEKFTPTLAQPGLRNHTQNHPVTGEPYDMVHHLPIGGFVPLGALLPDGSPHPHAGTGFAMAVIKAHPSDHKNPVPPVDRHGDMGYLSLLQLRFDPHSQKLLITSQERIAPDTFFPGWIMGWRGLSPAIPDGADLLCAHNAGQVDSSVETYFQKLKASGLKPLAGTNGPLGACNAAAISRWQFGPKGWRPVSMRRIPEPGPDMGFEPTLIRDADGSLLCSIRGKGANVPPGERDATGMQNSYESFRVYRSSDNGLTWHSHLAIHGVRAASPVTINKLADGSLYIFANPTYPIMKDSKGRTIPLVMHRQKLWAWPLSADRKSVGSPLCIFDAIERFGPPRPLDTHCCDNHWYLDHPLAMPCRLADGNWHNLLAFRIADGATNTGGALAPPQAGTCLMELPTPSQPTPAPWRF